MAGAIKCPIMWTQGYGGICEKCRFAIDGECAVTVIAANLKTANELLAAIKGNTDPEGDA